MPFHALPGSTYTFSLALEDQANAGLFKAAPTIAAGDFQRSINNGAFANLDNLPTVDPAAGRLVKIVLSAAETASAGDGGYIDIVGHDASGDEWYDVQAEVRVGYPAVNMTHRGGVPVAPADGFGYDPAHVLAWRGLEPASLNLAGEVQAVISGFSSQTVRDAMKLTPTAGDPAAGSIDKHLDDGATAAALAVVNTNVDAIKLITDDLDVSAVTQVVASSAGHLTITAGLTFDEAVTGLTIPADWEVAIWTLKIHEHQADTAARLQLRVSNPADGDDGLQRLNGAAVAVPITAADGTLTVTQASGRIDIYLTDELTALLDKASGLGWDVKFIDADGDSTGQRGTADVVLTETRTLA